MKRLAWGSAAPPSLLQRSCDPLLSGERRVRKTEARKGAGRAQAGAGVQRRAPTADPGGTWGATPCLGEQGVPVTLSWTCAPQTHLPTANLGLFLKCPFLFFFFFLPRLRVFFVCYFLIFVFVFVYFRI